MRNEREILKELCRRLEVSEKIIDEELSFLENYRLIMRCAFKQLAKRSFEVSGVKEIIKKRLQADKKILEKELNAIKQKRKRAASKHFEAAERIIDNSLWLLKIFTSAYTNE